MFSNFKNLYNLSDDNFSIIDFINLKDGSEFILTSSDNEYGNSTIYTATIINEKVLNHGATMHISFDGMHADYYYYCRNELTFESEFIYRSLQKIHNERGFLITAYSFYENNVKLPHSLEERFYSNRSEFFINDNYVGVYYVEEYYKKILKINQQLELEIDDLKPQLLGKNRNLFAINILD